MWWGYALRCLSINSHHNRLADLPAPSSFMSSRNACRISSFPTTPEPLPRPHSSPPPPRFEACSLWVGRWVGYTVSQSVSQSARHVYNLQSEEARASLAWLAAACWLLVTCLVALVEGLEHHGADLILRHPTPVPEHHHLVRGRGLGAGWSV